MATTEELEEQIEELRAKLHAVSKGAELKTGAHGFRVGNLRIFQHHAAAGDDRLYQEEPDGTRTNLSVSSGVYFIDFGTEIDGKEFAP